MDIFITHVTTVAKGVGGNVRTQKILWVSKYDTGIKAYRPLGCLKWCRHGKCVAVVVQYFVGLPCLDFIKQFMTKHKFYKEIKRYEQDVARSTGPGNSEGHRQGGHQGHETSEA